VLDSGQDPAGGFPTGGFPRGFSTHKGHDTIEPTDSGDHHPDVLAMRQYWEGKRRGRSMPSRADIDPFELKRFLPGLILIDVVEDARRYVYRLVGTREVAMRGRDPTGKSMLEGFFAANLEAALAIPDRVVATRAPLFIHRAFTAADGRIGDEDLIMLPLSNDGERVTMIMGYTHHRLA
jgi:hypothetical protein